MMLKKALILVLSVSLLTLSGLSTSVASPRGGGGGHGSGGTDDLVPLSGDEITGLLFMREEEKVARDSYITLGGIWKLTIFANIAESEQNHMDAIGKLIDKYDLEDPVVPGIGEYTDHHLQELYDALMLRGGQSMMDGLYVGAAIEETDIVDIQHEIELADHADIISTYQALMCGSRNHLRAFVRQIEDNGGTYTPGADYFPDSDIYFWDLAHTEMERDCKTAD